MAEAAIAAVLSKLGELAVSEARILLQVGDDIILLRDRLEWLQAVVRDADRKRRAGTIDGLTRVWVRQTRDVAFDAEDALDDYFHEEVVGPKDQGCCPRWRALRRYFTGLFTKIVVRHGLSGRIDLIKSRLDQISENQKEYQIVHTPSVGLTSSATAIAAWRQDLENAVGFDQDVEVLKKMLHRRNEGSPQHQHPMFISIVGESGAGKNTLAKIIHREMRSEIEVLVWCKMEPGFSTTDLLSEVLRRAYCQFTYYELREEEGTTEIGDKLRRLLARKSFLLILDGISSKTILNCVRASLPDDGGQVMLILDYENEEIAWHANTMNRYGVNGVHLLTRLDPARSAQLFFWKALRKGQHESSLLPLERERSEQSFFWKMFWKVQYEEESRSSNPKDDEYTRLVHHITGGYPMAIVLLAGLLRFKEKPVEWDAVLQQLSETQDVSQEGLINHQANLCGTRRAMEMIFWASFEELPNDLKSCFLYLASYPNSLSHPADDIVRMWIAEGFMKPQKGKTMEELGQDYLKELVLRCLVEVEEMKSNGGIQLVRVHKSLVGFLQWEVRETGFMEIQDIHDALVPPSARRLSFQSDNARRYATTIANKTFPKLRSFICHIIIYDKLSCYNSQDLKFLHGSKFIRVISVQGLRLASLPYEIGDMINLRYLRVDCPDLRSLPSSIARLLNLQTLDIRNTKVQLIDDNFWKIKTLRHVLASYLTLPIAMPDVVEEHEGGTDLQTLLSVKPATSGEWSAENCPLAKMTNLRSLRIHNFMHARHGGPAFEVALGNMHLLDSLAVQGDVIPSYVFTNPGLRSLQTMEFRGNVNWHEIIPLAHVLLKVRPNLVKLILNNDVANGIPPIIRHHLRGVRILCFSRP